MKHLTCRKIMFPIAALTLLAALTAALNLTAAPILPGARRATAIPDPTRSLKDIRQVRLNIEPIAAGVVEAGLTIPTIRRQWSERLVANGIEVVEDESAPLLTLFVNEIGDPAIPNAKGYVMTLHVIQAVKLERVDLSVKVPTFVFMIAGVEIPERLPDSVRDSATHMINVFVKSVQVANRTE